jgi:hypothetical protein
MRRTESAAVLFKGARAASTDRGLTPAERLKEWWRRVGDELSIRYMGRD